MSQCLVVFANKAVRAPDGGLTIYKGMFYLWKVDKRKVQISNKFKWVRYEIEPDEIIRSKIRWDQMGLGKKGKNEFKQVRDEMWLN